MGDVVEAITILGHELTHPALGSMTFPRFRRFLYPRLGPGVVGVLMRDMGVNGAEGRPLGLGLGFIPPEGSGGEGELLSLYVRPSHRGRGVGTGLLGALEEELRGRGCVGVSTVYMTRIPSLAAFEALLQTRGWSQPVRRMSIFKTDTARLREASWMPLFQTLPVGFEIVRWDTIGAAAREELKGTLGEAHGAVPRDVDPFLYEGVGIDGSPSEPELSLGCLHEGHVVGWPLVHRLGPGQVRFSCSYVRAEVQAQVPLLALWNHAFRRMPGERSTEVSWAIAPQHEAMAKFTQRLLGSFVTHADETRGARKPLGAGGSD